MVSKILQDTFANDYKDDFADSDNYHRILFNPARAVQARELTQSQTIIQRELERFGRNIFKEGAAVNPAANVTVNTRYSFVKLQGVTTLDSSYVGLTVTGATSGVQAKIIEVVDAEGSDPATLFVGYLTGNAAATAGSDTTIKFTPGETLTSSGSPLQVQTTNTTLNPATGFGTRVSVGQGEFFVLGHFVFTEKKDLLVSKYTTNPSLTVGWKVIENVVTAADNTALYDNQGDLPNTTAPGADRYQIKLELIDKDDIAADETFVYACRIEEGVVTDVNNGRTEYNRILDLLAERTYEESGNYTVKPFFAEWKVGDSDGELKLSITDGISYVKGYRYSSGRQTIDVIKPRTTTTFNNDTISVDYGNYVLIDSLNFIPTVDEFEQVDLRDNAVYGSGTTIGTARVKALEPDGANYRMYLFDIRMNPEKNFRDTKLIARDATLNAQVLLEGGVAVLKDPQNNDLFFPLSKPRLQSASDLVIRVQRTFTATTDGSGTAQFILSAAGEAFGNDWIVVNDSDGTVITPTITRTTDTQLDISSAPINTPITLHGFVQKGGTSALRKTKTLTTRTATIALPLDSDGNGTKWVDLERADIYELDSVRLGSAAGADISSRFTLDNGQRDNFYDNGRLILNTGSPEPTSSVYVKFKHFAHGTTGNFFSAASYTDAGIAYKDIPVYRQKNGVKVNLTSVLDFRSTINNAGTGFTGTGASISELPEDGELITADTTFYNGRADLLVATPTGIEYIYGTESISPQLPDVPAESMLLYSFTLNPYTLNPKDTSSRFTENRRFTMRDISKINDRISNVEEMVTLSMLDLQAATMDVLDSAGLNRAKSGFFTDDFRDLRGADLTTEEYRAAIHPSSGILTCSFRQKNVGLILDTSQSSNITVKRNLAMLSYTEEVYIDQPECSRTQNVNPYTRVNYDGTLILSPSTDEWKDEVTIQEIIETNVIDITPEPVETNPTNTDQDEQDLHHGDEAPAGGNWTQHTPGVWERQ